MRFRCSNTPQTRLELWHVSAMPEGQLLLVVRAGSATICGANSSAGEACTGGQIG